MGRRLVAALAVFVMMLTAVAVSPVSAVPPNDPGGVTAALNATLDGIDATWSAPVGGDPVVDYTVELLDAVPSVVTSATVAVPGLTHSFTAVAPGTYTVRVRANNADGPSGDVDSAPETVPDVPDAPAAPTAALNGTNDIQVDWVAPADGGSPITEYDVTLTASAGGPAPATFNVPAPGLTHTFTGVPFGTYTATVVAANTVGDSLPSPASAPPIVVVGPVPDDPTAVAAAVAGTVDLEVTWAAPAAGPTPTSYVITLDNGAATSFETANGTTFTHTFPGLNPGQTYVATVQSKNAAGSSTGVAAAAVTIPPKVPGQVAQPSATASGTDSIVVDWDAPAQNGSAIIDYDVAVTRAGGGPTTTQTVTAPTTIFTFTGLAPGNYTAEVSARNGVGDGPVSPASTSVALGDVPGSPTAVSASNPTATSMSVSFTAPANDGGSPITGYTVTATPVGGGTSRTANGNSPVSVSGLEPGTTYDFTVVANNAFGAGSASAADQATTLGAPDAPTGVSASLVPATSATVTFTAPTNNGGSAITGYTVTATPAGGGTTIQATGTGSPIEVSGLALGETYTFTVSASNAVGTGADSAPSTPGLLIPDVPVVPSNVTAENQTPFSSTVTITWTPPADDGGSPIVDYTVTIAGQTQTVAANADLSVIFTGVAVGVHTPTVTARNAGSTSGEATGPEVEVRGFPPFGSEEAFIRQLYLDFLSRPADQAGLDYWTSITNDDGSNIDEIVRSFMFSAEFNPRRAITRLYLAFFDRAPDLGGFDYWAGQINSGQANLDTISQSFVMSPEFVSTYGSLSDRDFIRLVYNNVLVRQPDQSGYDFWLNEMANGMTRGQLMTQFSESPEFVQNTRPAVDVIVTYRGMLDRVPDSAGFSFWLGQIANDQNAVLSLIIGFYNSPEYAGRIIP